MCNLKANYIFEGRSINKLSKYELDKSLFSYKEKHFLNYVYENIDINEFKKNVNINDLLNYRGKWEIDIKGYGETIIQRLNNINNKNFNDLIGKNIHNLNILEKYNKDLTLIPAFTFNKKKNDDYILLKLKIIGSNGKTIKCKKLEYVEINKKHSFGYLAERIAEYFNVDKELFHKIKIYFDGDILNKYLSIDDNDLNLEDNYQLDIKIPIVNNSENSENSEYSEDNEDERILYTGIVEYYVID